MGYTKRVIKNKVIDKRSGEVSPTYNKRSKRLYYYDCNGRGSNFMLRKSNGDTFIVKNLSEWCTMKGINYRSLYYTFYCGHYHKGYTVCERNVHIVDGRVFV